MNEKAAEKAIEWVFAGMGIAFTIPLIVIGIFIFLQIRKERQKKD